MINDERENKDKEKIIIKFLRLINYNYMMMKENKEKIIKFLHTNIIIT